MLFIQNGQRGTTAVVAVDLGRIECGTGRVLRRGMLQAFNQIWWDSCTSVWT